MPNYLDYIVVGQGIAGSWLAYHLIKRGKSIVIINRETEKCASLKSLGIYNPITGRKALSTWMVDSLFANIEQEYEEIEQKLKTKFLYQLSVYQLFTNIKDQNDWEIKFEDSQVRPFIKKIHKKPMSSTNKLNDIYGGVVLNHSGYVDIPKMIYAFRNYFRSQEVYHQGYFDYTQLVLQNQQVKYKNWTAKKIIFCEGSVTKNPYWRNLPFKPVRGDLMTISCSWSSPHIIKKGIFMIPKDNHFLIGSTYDHQVLNFEPQIYGIFELKERLNKLFNGTYTILSTLAGVRPATYDRRPFIGFHKKEEKIGIFGGFGTKGVSLSPFFAKHFLDYLEGNSKLNKETDVQRVD